MGLESNLRVATRDGVHLATDVYRPCRGGRPVAGRFPAILERTPYGRNVTYFASNFPHFDVNPNTGEPEAWG